MRMQNYFQAIQKFFILDTSIEPQKRRAKLLSAVLLISLIAMFFLTLENSLEFLFMRTEEYAVFLVQDLVVLVLLVIFAELNRRGHTQVTAITLIVMMVLGITLLFPSNELEGLMILYAIPIIAASFLLHPSATFGVVIFAFIDHSVTRGGIDLTDRYSFIGTTALVILAFIAWMISMLLDRALDLAGKSLGDFRSIVLDVDEGIARLDAETHFVFANPKVSLIFGLAPEKLLNCTLREFIVPEHQEILAQQLELRRQGKRSSYEVAIIRADGVRRTVVLTATPQYDHAHKFIGSLGTIRDITEQKERERILRRYEALSENARDIVLFVRASDGQIVEANYAACKAYGYTRQELSEKKIFDLRPQDSKPFVNSQMQQANRQGILFEAMHIRRDGSPFPVEISSRGVDIGDERLLLSIIRDITERKQTEELYHTLVASSPDGISLLDAEGRLLFASPRSLEMFRVDSDMILIGESLLRWFPPHEQARVVGNLEHLLQGADVSDREYELRREDGTWFFGEITTTLLRDTQGNVSQIMAIIRDITERKRAEFSRELLAQTARDLSRSLNLQDIYTTLYHGIKQAMPCASIIISQYNSADQLIRCAFGFDENGRMDVSQFPPIPLEAEGRGTQSLVIRSGQPLILNDYESRLKTAQTSYHITNGPKLVEEISDDEERPRSALIVPIKLDNQVVGVIQVFSLRRNDYTLEHLHFLESLGLYVSTALANARLYEQIQNELIERQRTEDALRENEAMFRGFIEQSSEGISLINSDGIVIEWNSAFENISGIPRIETLGEYAWNVQARLLPPRLRNDPVTNAMKEMMLNSLGSLQVASLKSTEGVLYTTRGETKTILQSLFPIVGPTGKYLGILLRDVTERKRTEQAIADNERRMRALVENIGDGIELVNTDGIVIYASPSVSRILGKPTKQMLGASISEMHPDDQASAASTMMQVMSSPGVPIQQSYRLRHADGTWRWFEGTATNLLHDPAVGSIVVNFRDVTERRCAEDALRESEGQFRILFDNVGEGIARVDSPGNFILANPALENIFGVPPHELLHHNILDFVPPDQRAKHSEQVSRRKQGLSNSYELQIVRPSGERRTVVITTTPWFNKTGDYAGAFGVFRDITESKRIEEALRESEELYRTLIETLDISLCRWLPDTTLVYANEKYRKIFGVQGQVIGVKWIDFLPIDTRTETTAFYRELGAHPHTVTYEHPVTVEDGSLRHYQWIDSPIYDQEGKLTAFQSVGIDITPRKLAEEQLRESQARIELALQGANLAMWDWYIQTGKTIFNERWADMLGYTLAELEPSSIQTWIKLSHPDDLLKSNELLQQHFNQQTEYYECEVRMRHKNGSWVWVTDRGKVVERDANGTPIRMTGTHMDITERKRSEDELRESEDRYRRAIIAADAIPYVRDYNAGQYVFIGSGIEKLTGYANHEFTPQVLDSLILESIMQGDLKGYPPKEAAQIVRQGKIGITWKCDHRIHTRNGTECWLSDSSVQIVDEYGVPKGSIGIIQDITERKETERVLEERVQQRTAELRESEEQNRLLFDHVPLGIVLFDSTGHVVRMNHAFESLTELSMNLFIGHTLDQVGLLPPDQIAKLATATTQFLSSSSGYTTTEFKIRRTDGELRDLSTRVFAIKIGGEQHYLTTMHDITAEKKTEETLRLANTEMERALRMKDEFLANMSHELRTPLNAILGLSESLIEQFIGPLNERQLSSLQTIETSGRH